MAIFICSRDGKETIDLRDFFCSLGTSVKRFAKAAHRQWGIENACHWCIDVTSREDDSRIRQTKLRETITWLNRLILSLLKQNGNGKSVTMNRRRYRWKNDVLEQIPTWKAS